jgi:hypothetical protein
MNDVIFQRLFEFGPPRTQHGPGGAKPPRTSISPFASRGLDRCR